MGFTHFTHTIFEIIEIGCNYLSLSISTLGDRKNIKQNMKGKTVYLLRLLYISSYQRSLGDGVFKK